jgi:hypothetical protein
MKMTKTELTSKIEHYKQALVAAHEFDAFIEALAKIMADEYAPYNEMGAFWSGKLAYREGNYENPYPNDACAQAWDRGLELGMRLAREGL